MAAEAGSLYRKASSSVPQEADRTPSAGVDCLVLYAVGVVEIGGKKMSKRTPLKYKYKVGRAYHRVYKGAKGGYYVVDAKGRRLYFSDLDHVRRVCKAG